MLSRALILATVALLIGSFTAAPTPVQAQNLEAGKSPSQIFSGTCTACHKSARGLLRTVPAGSLTGFLRQHYTTSPEMAGLLSAFLISNGAADTRYGGQPKAGKPVGSPPEQLDRPSRRLRGAASREGAEPQQAAEPDQDGSRLGRRGRNARRSARPGEPSRESSKGDAAKEESSKPEPKEEKPAAESAKDEGGKSSVEGTPETAKPETPKDAGNGQSPVQRADPVPPVTPAPDAPATASSAPEPAAGPSTSAASSAPTASQPVPPAAADSASSPAPAAPASPEPSTPK